MTDIFLSYKRQDQERVAPIVEGLRAAGLSVWWDRDIGGGEPWRQRIAAELATAKCVIVVWSETSVGPEGEFVLDEAGRAKARGVLLPVRIDAVQEPVGFGELQSLDLTGWNGSRRERRFRMLAETAKAIVSGGPRPRVRALSERTRRIAAFLSLAGTLSAILGFAADLIGVQSLTCKAPGIHALCARWGLGGVPTREEAALWAARAPGDCAGLKSYLNRFPRGAYAEEAGQRVLAAQRKTETRWERKTIALDVAVRSTEEPFAAEKAARQDALQRGQGEAAKKCGDYRSAGYRIVSARLENPSWHCFAKGSGTVCSLDGQANCQVEEPRVETREVCP